MSPVKSAASSPPGAGPQLDDDVAIVVRVALDQRQPQLVLDLPELRLAARELGLEEGAHVGILLALEQLARICVPTAGGTPTLPGRGLLAQLLVAPAELRHAGRSEETSGSESSRSTSANACSIWATSSSISAEA